MLTLQQEQKQTFQANTSHLYTLKWVAWLIFSIFAVADIASVGLLIASKNIMVFMILNLACIVCMALAFVRIQLLARTIRYFDAMKGKSECSVEMLCECVGLSSKDVLGDLKQIQQRGWIYPIFVAKNKKEILTEKSRCKPDNSQKAQKQSKKQSHRTKTTTLIKEMKCLNKTIENPIVSEKVNTLYQLAQEIFEQAKQTEVHPAVYKKFETYYLPTTLKLLRIYTDADDKAVETIGNAQKVKTEIPMLLDTLIEAYRNILDSFYADIAMNVSSEISVLKDMLAQEGLVETENVFQINE